jgi:hypothetical protein
VQSASFELRVRTRPEFSGARLSFLRDFQHDVIEQARHYGVALGVQVLVVPPEDPAKADLGERRAELEMRHVMTFGPIADPAVAPAVVEARVVTLRPQWKRASESAG